MSLMNKITESTKRILDSKFDHSGYDYVPTHDNTVIGKLNKGLQFTAATLFIDMRGSTGVLEKHNKTTVAKIHKVYYEVIIPIVMRLGGRIRSCNGDSMLVFFTGKRMNAIGNAIKSALQINFAFMDEVMGINKYLSRYSALDYGIGIDYGTVMCTKIGSNKYKYSSDLIWIGSPVNRSVKLGDQAAHPNHISISPTVFEGLSDRWKYRYRKSWFGKEKFIFWSKGSYRYNSLKEACYQTDYRYPVS